MDTKSTSKNKTQTKNVCKAKRPNTTISCVSQEVKPVSSVSASNPSHAEVSYAVLNLELSYLFATNITPFQPINAPRTLKPCPFLVKSHGRNLDSAYQPYILNTPYYHSVID